MVCSNMLHYDLRLIDCRVDPVTSYAIVRDIGEIHPKSSRLEKIDADCVEIVSPRGASFCELRLHFVLLS